MLVKIVIMYIIILFYKKNKYVYYMDNNQYIDHLNNNFKSIACISKKFDFIFYTIYKNASTKVRSELLEEVYKFNKSKKHPKNSEKATLIINNNNLIIQKLNNYTIKNIYKVAFVRNPIDRYRSLFNYFKGSKRGRLMKIYNNT